MLVSRNALQSYTELQGANNPNFFENRQARNAYYSNQGTIRTGQYCAVGGDPTSTNWDEVIWEVEQYNGVNWAVIPLNTNFALTVTNDGIKALTDALKGQYKLEISRVAIKQTPIPAGDLPATWTKEKFIASNGYIDVCLDTNNTSNPTFTLSDNLTYRTNLLNGGLQFTVELGLDCMGQSASSESTSITPTLTEFKLATIALFAVDQRDTTAPKEVLFAIANLPTTVTKLATTPTQVGNALKFYLNTTLTNMGNVTNLQVIKSSVNSIPEVTTEDELIDTYDGINSPYNIYLIDNLGGTNVPALAVRKGDPVSSTNPIVWTYFTPTDDNLQVDPALIDTEHLKNFMIAAWDTETNMYVPADGKHIPINDNDNETYSQQPAGLYANGYLTYAGKVNNFNAAYTYSYAFDNTTAVNYAPGETLICTMADQVNLGNSLTFTIRITETNPETGKPLSFHVSPVYGNVNIGNNNDFGTADVVYRLNEQGRGEGLLGKFNALSTAEAQIIWNFPNSWINKPLYADYDHSNETQAAWNAYCALTGLDTNTAKDRRGNFTIVRTEMFIGWCLGSNSVKLALDLRNEATEVTFGTTRYATNTEVSNVAANPDAAVASSITPATLKNNYLQITKVAGNTGENPTNPIQVNSHVKFNEAIYGKGINYQPTDLANVSFYGTAYRALWEDLAEYYRSDRVYPAGTLICIGSGYGEITEAKTECNGIISTKPGYELGEKKDPLDLPVALIGKVPVLFAEDCIPEFGDRIYLSKTMPGRASTIPNGKCLGKIIDKREHLDQTSTILCSVRIEF